MVHLFLHLYSRCTLVLFVFTFIYINDLPNVSKCLSFYLFADDTKIYLDASDTIKLQKIMDRELRHVKKWLEANKLALNIEKKQLFDFSFPSQKGH